MIYNINNIDILGERKDGGVDMVIVSTGGLDDSAETQTALMDKIENYLSYITTKEFNDKFGVLTADKINIILKIDKPLSELNKALFENIVSWVKENGATIHLELT